MKRFLFFIFSVFPLVAFSQNKVDPDGYKLLVIILIVVTLPLLLYLFMRIFKKKQRQKSSFSFHWKKLKVTLEKDQKYRPKNLTLRIVNVSNRNIDIEAPLLHFRKLWSKRNFKLKGINRQEIYPLYLEKGKTHELQIDLNVFHQHDRKLKKFYWAKIRFQDSKRRKYSSKYITLRRSLFS